MDGVRVLEMADGFDFEQETEGVMQKENASAAWEQSAVGLDFSSGTSEGVGVYAA